MKNCMKCQNKSKKKGKRVLPVFGERNLAKRMIKNDKNMRWSYIRIGEREKSLKTFEKVSLKMSRFFFKKTWFMIFDWSKNSFNQSNIVNQVFKKTNLDLFKLTFSKVSKLFSLSPIWTWLHLRFLSFFIILFARFLSPYTGKTLLPFFLLLFSHFMHFSCILIWGFWTYTYLGFLMIQAIFSKIDHWVLFLWCY